jgi:hypothetical protein
MASIHLRERGGKRERSVPPNGLRADTTGV